MALKVQSTTLADHFMQLKELLDAEIPKQPEKETSSNLELRMEAGVALSLALANMQSAYAPFLTTLIDKVGSTVKHTLDQFGVMIQQFQEGEILNFISIPTRALAFIDLPSKDQTKFVRIWACPKVVLGMYEVSVQCEGFFPYANRYQPSLSIADKPKSVAIQPTTSLLQFSYDGIKILEDRPFCAPVCITTPIETGVVRSVPAEVLHHIWVKIPPLQIGTLEIHVHLVEKTKDERIVTSSLMTARGNAESPFQWTESEYPIVLEQGWMMSAMEPSILEGTAGAYKMIWTPLGVEGVKLKIGVSAEGTNPLSIVHFSAKYTAIRTQRSEERRVGKECRL